MKLVGPIQAFIQHHQRTVVSQAFGVTASANTDPYLKFSVTSLPYGLIVQMKSMTKSLSVCTIV